LPAVAAGVRGHDIEEAETFSLLAEVAIALAGFTGVAAAFGGRSREYSAADRVRLDAIFLSSACVLAISLCVLTLKSILLDAETVYAYSGLLGAFFLVWFLYPLTPRTYALARDADTSTSLSIVTLGTLQNVISLVLILANFIVWRSAGPLLAAASIQIMWSLLLFARLLVRPN